MKKIWWSWDLRMRWAWGFCRDEKSYVKNYKNAIDSAVQYGVEAMVIWGFLRDSHGGIDAAKRISDYAAEKNIVIMPGVGIDDYGGIYHEGESPYSLDTYIKAHPESQARTEDGTPATCKHPAGAKTARLKACPSDENLISYYQESLLWLIDTFDLKGFQIEQGDTGVCFCERCRSREGIVEVNNRVSVSDSAERISKVVLPVIQTYPEMFILSETYLALKEDQLEWIEPFLDIYPEQVVLSWALYFAWAGEILIDEGIKSPRTHGNAAILTNNDITRGELDDRENIKEALRRSKDAGLDMTYIYGEYPDQWPLTCKNYETWAEYAE